MASFTELFELVETEPSDKVAALLCVGVSKLVMSGKITDMAVRMHELAAFF